MRVRVFIASVGLLGLFVAGSASGALAQQYPIGGATFGVSNTNPFQGETITGVGTGWQAGSQVPIEVNPPLGTATVNGAGQFSIQLTIPADLSPGPHTITATGRDAAGSPVTRSVAINVRARSAGAAGAAGAAGGGRAAGGGALPRTGTASTTPLTAAGVGLVLIGAFAVATTRRRRIAAAIES